MLTSVTLQNFKSFGVERTIPLQPLTVLVGPNNSGKSCFVSVGRLVRNAVGQGVPHAIEVEGGPGAVFHRPSSENAKLRIGWTASTSDPAGREARYSTVLVRDEAMVFSHEEFLEHPGEKIELLEEHRHDELSMDLLKGVNDAYGYDGRSELTFLDAVAPLARSRLIKLSTNALLQDAQVVPDPKLGSNGSGLAAVLGLWLVDDVRRAQELDDFVRRCLPEIEHVLARPAPEAGKQRLWIQQRDGERFDALHVSDGVLCFIALTAHAIEAEPGSLLFVEDPDLSIHPGGLRHLVDLLRRIVHERKCQVVVATHSPVLLHEFRDEPESILLFRRSDQGTLVDPLTRFPHLMEALDEKRADPADMLVNGFLNEPS